MSENYYASRKEIEDTWQKWLDFDDKQAWNRLCEIIYLICKKVSYKFNPKDEEEHLELTHHAFERTIFKIKNGKAGVKPKLIMIPSSKGGKNQFNLLTTVVFNHLYSLKNSQSRRSKHMAKLREKIENDGSMIVPAVS